MRKIVLVLLGIIALSGAVGLSGCNTVKFGECLFRDNTPYPCNW